MLNVGFAAWSTGTEGCACRVRPSNCCGCTGGGTRGPPFTEDASSSYSALRLGETAEAEVEGLDAVDCLVLDASSFTGGIGAEGSSAGSRPSGPRGPMESLSRLSRVVDCVRLPCRRGPLDLEGAGLAPPRFGVDWASFEGGDCSVRATVSNHARTLRASSVCTV